MKAIGVIPARYGSIRFPGKPLALISGKPLLQWVFEASRKSQRLDEIIVATDDERIAQLCKKMGATYVMTEPDSPSGSDRVWEAIREVETHIVLNIQGDEPLIQPQFLDILVETIALGGSDMATLGGELPETELESIHTVKVVCNHRNEAIYFSRFPIPHSKDLTKGVRRKPFSLKHIGIYAYKKEFLGRFCLQPPVEIEQAEGLEQLRALYLGARIQVIPVDFESWGVDRPEDIAKVESQLQS